ncbi:MAG: biotin--[Clostridia bacterium]|nr:biotin--[acetyl-CoA-carboxylase] ligase [Clostridia bacterium]
MHELIHLDTVDSTNEYLKRLSRDAQDGLTVWADEQTLGKGRLGRRWVSQRGQGAWFSVIVKDARLPPQNASGLVFVCALAAARSLAKLAASTKLSIKWPNDIVLNGKKIAGILCESGYEGDTLSWSICGIGINLTGLTFPPELPWAASIASETGVQLKCLDVIEEFLSAFDTGLETLFANGLGAVLNEIKPLSATLGKTVSADMHGESLIGKAIDFAPDGALLIEAGGTIHKINVGDVSVRGVMGYVN